MLPDTPDNQALLLEVGGRVPGPLISAGAHKAEPLRHALPYERKGGPIACGGRGDGGGVKKGMLLVAGRVRGGGMEGGSRGG